ncbi:MAG TPA: YfiR family protein, partial [bacterium]|nr:YfiR family protein [bacterium]
KPLTPTLSPGGRGGYFFKTRFCYRFFAKFRWLSRAGFALVLLLGAGVLSLRAETPVSKEYQVKAVFLFNFAQFVKWPRAAFTRENEPFRIGILGEDPFDAFLDETVKGEKVDGHPLLIRRCNGIEDAKNCQIVFVSRSESQRMENILAGLKGRNILTVSDTEGFIKSGGIVRFVTEGNKVHFRINPEAAKRVKLAISSKVLRLAEIAQPGQD